MARAAKKPKVEIDPDHKLPTRELILKILGEEWLTTPNTKVLGRAPEELIGTPEEASLRNRVFLYKDGAFS